MIKNTLKVASKGNPKIS